MNGNYDSEIPIADEFDIADSLIKSFERELDINSNISFTVRPLHIEKDLSTYRFWKRVHNLGVLRELHNSKNVTKTYSGQEIEKLEDYLIWPISLNNIFLRIDASGFNIGSAVFSINSSLELFLANGLIDRRFLPIESKSEIDFLFKTFEQVVRENALAGFSSYVSAQNIALNEQLLNNTDFRKPAFNFNEQDFYWYSVDCSH